MSNLYIVGTPIGNISDLSERAKTVLQEADIVICEDTRVTQKLMQRIDADAKLLSIHQHSDDASIDHVLDMILDGHTAAYVSDAGTPNISDPGGKLVSHAVKRDVSIIPIPGPSAITTALSVCGFPADRFTFLGFAPHKKGRQSFFQDIDSIDHTVVLYESKHRIQKALAALPQDRQAMVARELTKMHETLYRGTIEEITQQLENSSQKGEFVIILAPKNWI